MDIDEFETYDDMNRWNEKTPAEVLAESFHEIRDPIYVMTGYLNVIKETEVSPDQLKAIMTSLLRFALHSKYIVDSVYHYLAVQRGDK